MLRASWCVTSVVVGSPLHDAGRAPNCPRTNKLGFTRHSQRRERDDTARVVYMPGVGAKGLATAAAATNDP